MSSFLKRGLRRSKAKEKIKVRKSIKKMYKTLHEMDRVAVQMIKSGVAIKEENVKEEASKYTEHEIGEYEKFILLGKVNQVYDKLGIKVKEDEDKSKEHK